MLGDHRLIVSISINTNVAAAQAAQALSAADAQVRDVSQRVQSGRKVSSAKDDGATWAIAQNMRNRLVSWHAADESLARGQSVLEVAAAGAGQIADVLAQMKAKAIAFQDPAADASSREALKTDLKALTALVDRTAMNAEFSGRRPLADELTTTTVTSTLSTYTVPPAPLTPPSLAGALQPAAGGASQTFTRDGGPTAGRIDLYLQAYTVPDVLEIWQAGARLAATGQAYPPGGAAVGPGSPVSGQQVLSFDYDPAQGRALQFRFNENVNASGSLWNVDGVVLQNLSDPLPSPTTTVVTGSYTTSAATTYDFIRGPDGETENVSAKPLTAEALGLSAVDWNDPGNLLSTIDQAMTTATGAAAYFGERQQALSQAQEQNRKSEDVLEAGVGALVDADLAHEGAALAAGKVREQLAAQALGVAAQGSRALLSLFQA